MRPARLRALICGVVLSVAGIGVAGCGSSSSSSSLSSSATSSSVTSSAVTSSTSSASSTTSTAAVLAADRVARDLVRAHVKPRLTSAHCALESPAERARSPFGSIGGTVYACLLARSAAPVTYDVQVLSNGCFVAERRKPGEAIYGCGIRR